MRPPDQFTPDEQGDIGRITLSFCGSLDGVILQVVGWGYEAARHEPWDRVGVLAQPRPIPRSVRQDIQRDVIDSATRAGCLDQIRFHVSDLVRSAQFQGPLQNYAQNGRGLEVETRLGVVLSGLLNDLYDQFMGREPTDDDWSNAEVAFRLGIAQTLYCIWDEQLLAQRLPGDQWMPEIADGPVVPDDHLEGMLSPNWVGDCELNAWGPNGWLLTSEKGLRKASHSTSFVSFLGVAYVAHVGKNDHRLTVPIRSHVDALGELGFRQLVMAGGREVTL